MFAQRAVFSVVVVLMAFHFNDGTNETFGQRRLFQLGGPNGIVAGGGQGIRIGGVRGVQLGGGQGLRFGPPGYGVQYGGGQLLRYGTPNAGVMVGGGQGIRLGTPRAGVQYGGGQGIRYGTPNAGVQLGAGQGVRFGSQRGGLQFGTGQGLQIGRFNNVGQGIPTGRGYIAPATAQRIVGNQPGQAYPTVQATAVSPVNGQVVQAGSVPTYTGQTFSAGTGTIASSQPPVVPQNSAPITLSAPQVDLAAQPLPNVTTAATEADSPTDPASTENGQVDKSQDVQASETSILEQAAEKGGIPNVPAKEETPLKEDTSGAAGALDADGNLIEAVKTQAESVPQKLDFGK